MGNSIRDNNPNKSVNKGVKIGALDQFSSIVDNQYRAFLIKKSEKLASALYIITGFIPSEDPVRSKIRGAALDLVSLSASSSHFNESHSHIFGDRCTEIAAFLESAQYAGLISPMNAKLICDEYASLATFVRENYMKLGVANRPVMPDDIHTSHGVSPGSSSKGQRKGHKVALMIPGDSDRSDTAGRKNKIVQLVKKTGIISIKDARHELSHLGEKTVQRLLLSLVRDGILEKLGSKRWSTYRVKLSNEPRATVTDGRADIE